MAERAAAVLVASAVYIRFNESFANWQAVWFCARRWRLPSRWLLPVLGAGRARLRISRPAASADRSALCSTTPKAAAANATVAKTIDGRSRLKQRRRQRDAAEHLIREQNIDEPERVAQPGREPALAGERDG